MSGLLRVVAEQVSLSRLSRFLNKWGWKPEKVADTWQAHFRQRMEALVQAEHTRLKAELPKQVGRPRQTVVTGFLIFDDSVHEKLKGRKMGGLGRHFSNRAESGQWALFIHGLVFAVGPALSPKSQNVLPGAGLSKGGDPFPEQDYDGRRRDRAV